MFRIQTYFFIFLLSLGYCFGQVDFKESDLVFSHLKVKDGLPDDETTCIYQDKRGYIWIGTTNGLSCYSGNRMLLFRHSAKDSLTIPDDFVLSIAEDSSNYLWIATNKGLSKINSITRKIEKVYGQFKNMNNNAVLFVDQNKTLWMGSFGLHSFDTTCNCFHEYTNNNFSKETDFKKSNLITTIYQDSRKRMWVGTQMGLYQFDPKSGIFIKVFKDKNSGTKNPAKITIGEVYEDHNNQLWLGTWGLGLVKFFPDAQSFISFPVKNSMTDQASYFNVVGNIRETKDAKGYYNFWVSTDRGFARFKEETKKYSFIESNASDTRSISKSGIKQLLYDRAGMLWIATQSDGVNILNPYRQLFHSHHFNAEALSPAKTFGYINSIFTNNKEIWVTTWYGNGVYQLDKAFSILKKWKRVPPYSSSEENNRCNDVFRDRDGLVWISTLNGLYALEEKSGKFKTFLNNPADTNSIPSNKVIKYFEDSNGISWVGFYKKGICKFDKHTGRFYDYNPGVKHEEGLTDYFNVWSIMEDHAHNVWFADDGLGLWKYDQKDRTVQQMFKEDLKESHIASICEGGNNTVWIATSSGLGRIVGDSIQLLTTSDGLPTNNVLGVVGDNQERVWIGTSRGLVLYDPQKLDFRIFKEEDGLEKADPNGVILTKLSDGRIVFATGEKIMDFDPSSVTGNQSPPPIYISSFQVFGKRYYWTEGKSGKEIRLSYDQDQVSLDFDLLDYSSPTNTRFQYQLDGLDKSWTTTTNGHANYNNLDPGTYIFKVRGKNRDGIANEKGDSITIFLSPPFWKTWWFLSLCTLLIFVLVYILFRIRIHQVLKMERLRMKISTDLHDDVGSTLSSISILSDIILKEKDRPLAAELLGQIKSNSITLMDRMDDIVWSINPKHDTLEGLLLRIKQSGASLFEAKGINYEFETDDVSNIKLPMEYRQHLYLIVKEAINNLIKFSECTYAKIQISISKPYLFIDVVDNGKGFIPTSNFEGNGLESIRNRASLMHAELGIISAPEKGTTISLKIKIK